MSKLKNITSNVVTLQMFNIANPKVNSVPKDTVLIMKPGAVVKESDWVVADLTDPSYNAEIIDTYIQQGILSRLK